jgi:hypothetical protein
MHLLCGWAKLESYKIVKIIYKIEHTHIGTVTLYVKLYVKL